jgi:heme/copper-type cytochrome/quinol oxidase subunit 2
MADNTGAGPEQEPITAVPRWVKVLAIVILIVVVVFVIGIFAGLHDPTRWGHG